MLEVIDYLAPRVEYIENPVGSACSLGKHRGVVPTGEGPSFTSAFAPPLLCGDS